MQNSLNSLNARQQEARQSYEGQQSNPYMTGSDDSEAALADDLIEAFHSVRATTRELCSHLRPEDTVAQSMPDASPTKWHLAHTTWFFEQFVLRNDPGFQGRREQHPRWMEMFNSYYQGVGPQFPRAQRGLLSRPTLNEVMEYRDFIDHEMDALLRRTAGASDTSSMRLAVETGLHHEQQHQELMLTDIKHLFSLNPMEPVYCAPVRPQKARSSMSARRQASQVAGRLQGPPSELPLRFLKGTDGIVSIGHEGDRFAYDNETPRHSVLLLPSEIANRPVNNREYCEFIREGGYHNPALWMAEGWDLVRREGWLRPLYWAEDLHSAFTLNGRRELDPLAPVCHISFFEAQAFAVWAGARLPLEAEWEVTATAHERDGAIENFVESGVLQPVAPQPPGDDLHAVQLFGDVWEWTGSPYVGYPGFRPLPGALGEYNGKFMCGQWVLRGGSCASAATHLRSTYRNYFPPSARWQFSGLRLARDL